MLIKNLCYPAIATFVLSTATYQLNAQAKVTWGDEFKMHKGSTDLAILQVDKSGIYMEESHEALKSYFVIGATMRKSSTLVKLDANMAEQYRNDFDKELRGKEFDRLFFIKDKLYLFATDYSKKDNSLFLYAAEIDKSTGSLKGDWQQVIAWEKNDKSEQINYTIAPNSDSSRIVVTGTYTGRSQNRYEIKMMDINLRPVGKPMIITNEFDPKTFQVERLEYTPSGNAVLVGRIYDYEEGKKKKDKNLVFQNYSIRLYNPDGKMIQEVKTDIDNNYLVNSKVLLLKNQLVLAAFYSYDKKKREINGLLVERLDPATGNVLGTTKQPMNNGLISQVEEEDDDKDSGKKDKDDQDDMAGLAGNVRFRDVYATPDNGLLILAEKFRKVVTTSSTYNAPTGGFSRGSTTSSTRVDYYCEDIYMVKISANGDIAWMHDLPKSQDEEEYVSSNTTYGSGISFSSYFELPENRPFFAGFGSVAGKGVVHIFFNDNDDNADVLQPGKKIKRARNFGKSTCYEIDLDMASGKYTRKSLYTNKDIPVSMPRLGVSLNNALYLTGKEDRTFGKTKLIVGKIACPD
jgi:hypothetical protein